MKLTQYKHGDIVRCVEDFQGFKAGQTYRLSKSEYNKYSSYYHDGLITKEQDTLVVLRDEYCRLASCPWLYHKDVYVNFTKVSNKKNYQPLWL